MSEPITGEVRTSVATVIQGFTDAELALREVAGAIDGFRSAAEQLSEAREDQAAARLALAETAQVTDRVAQQVAGVVDGLRDTVAILSAIDPERLWQELEKIGSQQTGTAATIEARMTTLDREFRRIAWLSAAAFVTGLVAVGFLLAIVAGLISVK